MTVGIYIRVSTEEQAKEGFSISAQRERLKAYCFAQGWEDYKLYVDEGVSAKNDNRPELQRLFKHIEEQAIDMILVYKLDRLTRSVNDLNKILQLLRKHGATFRSATEVFDTSSATGRLFIQIVGSMAEWESDNLGERVRVGQIEKARQGLWSAQAPFGFKKVDKKLVIVEEQKQILLDIIERVRSGDSVRKIANYLTHRGIKPVRGYKWHIRTILDLLQNPAMHGAMRWRDEIIQDTHEGILTKDEFDSLQRLITSRQNFKKREVSSTFIYQMKIVCPVCGNHLSSERIAWERKTTKEKMVKNHYRCQSCALEGRTPAFRISEENMNLALRAHIEDILLDTNIKRSVKEKESTVLTEMTIIENQRNKYQRAWASDLMTDEEFADRMKETKYILEELKVLLKEEEKGYEADPEDVKRFAGAFSENWNELSVEEKREFIQRFVLSIKVERISGTLGKGYRNHVYEVTNVDFV